MADRFVGSDGTTIGLRSRIEHFGLAAVGAKLPLKIARSSIGRFPVGCT
jgi:hypothetical protein